MLLLLSGGLFQLLLPNWPFLNRRLRPELDQRVDCICVGERVKQPDENRTCLLAHPGLGVCEPIFAASLGLGI